MLAKGSVNVEDAYGFTIRESNQAVFIFQVENVTRTETILREAGLQVLSDSELYFI